MCCLLAILNTLIIDDRCNRNSVTFEKWLDILLL